MKFYKRDGTPYPEGPNYEAALAWAEAYEHDDKRVLKSHGPWGDLVSTIFDGLDSRDGTGGKPMIFETVIVPRWGGAWYKERYATEKEAIDGHHIAQYVAWAPPISFIRAWWTCAVYWWLS